MLVHVLAETSMRTPIASLCGSNCYLWGVAPGVPRVLICLRNLRAHPIEVPAQAIVDQVTPAYQVPPVVLPMEASGGSACGSQKAWILEALNLQGLGEWPEEEQEQARELLLKWEHLFVHSDLDLGQHVLDQALA